MSSYLLNFLIANILEPKWLNLYYIYIHQLGLLFDDEGPKSRGPSRIGGPDLPSKPQIQNTHKKNGSLSQIY
jgi:hypothetical protein